jgi:Sec-independent protein translocase protein TatA
MGGFSLWHILIFAIIVLLLLAASLLQHDGDV